MPVSARTFKVNLLSELLGDLRFRKAIRQGTDKKTGEIYTVVKVEMEDEDDFVEVQVYGLEIDDIPKNLKKYDAVDFSGVEYIARANGRAMGTFVSGEISEQIKVQKLVTDKKTNNSNPDNK